MCVCMCVLPEEQLMDLLLDCSHRLVPAVMAALNWNYIHTHTDTHTRVHIKRELHIIAISLCAGTFVCILKSGRAGVLPLGGHFKVLQKDGWTPTEGQAKHQRGWDNWTSLKRCIYAFINRSLLFSVSCLLISVESVTRWLVALIVILFLKW